MIWRSADLRNVAKCAATDKCVVQHWLLDPNPSFAKAISRCSSTRYFAAWPQRRCIGLCLMKSSTTIYAVSLSLPFACDWICVIKGCFGSKRFEAGAATEEQVSNSRRGHRPINIPHNQAEWCILLTVSVGHSSCVLPWGSIKHLCCRARRRRAGPSVPGAAVHLGEWRRKLVVLPCESCKRSTDRQTAHQIRRSALLRPLSWQCLEDMR